MPESLRDLIDRIGGERRLLILVVGVATVAALWGFSRWALAPAWVPLFPGMPIESIAEVTPKLDEQSIQYRLQKGGSEIQVQESDLAKARVLLARDGYPSKGRPGFELFDQPTWSMTDFTQRINYRRALEGELERTISQMRGITGAEVHLALNESSPFHDDKKPEQASVVVKAVGGARPDADVVEGIASLVASSVDGLSSDNVTVLDDSGRLLTGGDDPSGSALTKRQLAAQREVEDYLEKKTEDLVSEVVGPGNVRVRVAAALNFQHVERTTQSVDPDAQIATREDKTEVTPGPNTPGAASTATSTTYETSRKIETVTGGEGAIQRLTVAVLLNEKPPTVKGGAPQPRSPEELARVEALVRNAVGVDSTRGDAISVVSIPFDVTPAPVVTPVKVDVWTRLREFQRPALKILGLLLVFFLALRVLKLLRPAPSPPAAPEALPSGAAAAMVTAGGDGEGEAKAEQRAEASPPPAQLSLASAQPELAARVIRAWIQE